MKEKCCHISVTGEAMGAQAQDAPSPAGHRTPPVPPGTGRPQTLRAHDAPSPHRAQDSPSPHWGTTNSGRQCRG